LSGAGPAARPARAAGEPVGAMPTLQVPGLNIQLPLEDLEEGVPLGEVAPVVVEAAARENLTQWLGGMAEVGGDPRWDAARRSWVGTLRYLGEDHQWVIR